MAHTWLRFTAAMINGVLAFVVMCTYEGAVCGQKKAHNDVNNESALILMRSNEGRLGDQILFYTAAKWYSWNWGIPFFHARSHHLKDFILDPEDGIYPFYTEKLFDGEKVIASGVQYDSSKSILYKLPFSRACGCVFRMLRHPGEYKHFLERIRDIIKPKYKVTKTVIPQHAISVAVHIRKGSGTDQHQSNLKQLFTDKFLSDRYYTEQIRRVSEYFNDQSLYVYLFSDYADVTIIKKYYESALSDKKNIIIDCNKNDQDDTFLTETGNMVGRGLRSRNIGELYGDAYKDTIISDLYSMASFDCLIRSHSHFAQSAELLGEHKIVVSPNQVYWDKEKDEVIVRTINFFIKDREWCARAVQRAYNNKNGRKR